MKTILVVAAFLGVGSAHATVLSHFSDLRLPAMVLQGTPVFNANPASVDMGPVAVGVSTPVFGTPPPFAEPLQISNTGSAPLTSNFSFSSPEFGFDSATTISSPLTVAAGSSVTGGLAFKPTAAGPRTGQFVSNDNAAGSPHSVALSGTGITVANNDFGIVLDPSEPSTIVLKAGQTTTFKDVGPGGAWAQCLIQRGWIGKLHWRPQGFHMQCFSSDLLCWIQPTEFTWNDDRVCGFTGRGRGLSSRAAGFLGICVSTGSVAYLSEQESCHSVSGCLRFAGNDDFYDCVRRWEWVFQCKSARDNCASNRTGRDSYNDGAGQRAVTRADAVFRPTNSEREFMRLGIVLPGLVLAVVIVGGSTCSAHTLAQFPAGFRPMLFQGTPGFSTTPASPIDLGPSAVGMTTPHASPLPLQINNPGTAPLSVSSFSFSSLDAAFTSESLFLPPITVAAGSSRTPSVLFTPQSAGPRIVQLAFNDNAPGSPHIVQFTGTGVSVPANDIGVILDPGIPSTVTVARGSNTMFPIWLLAGASPTNINVTVQCSGGPTGTACSLDHNSTTLTGDGFGPTRDKFMVTVSVPAKSALHFRGRRNFWWAAAFAFGILLVQKNRRSVLRFAAIATLLITSVLIISCGSSSTGGTGSNTLVIMATPSPGTPHSLSVPLVVQ